MASSGKLTTEETNVGIKDPVLVVDKEGVLGRQLILKLGNQTQVVIVSRSKPTLPEEFLTSVIHVPFIKKVPTIPDGKYSVFFIIENKFADLITLLSSFVQKADRDSLPIVFGLPIVGAKDVFLSEVMNKYPRLKILVYGDVFNNDLSFDQTSLINKFLYDAIVYRRIEIPSDGLLTTYPVFIDDVVMAILETVFGSHGAQKLFYAFPKHSPTALSLARSIQKADPEIKMDMSRKAEVVDSPPSLSGTFLLPDNYSLDSKIKKIISKNQTADLDKIIKSNSKKTHGKNSKFPLRSFFYSVLFFMILPFVATISFVLIGALGLWQAQSAFSNGNISLAYFFADSSRQSFSISRATFEVFNLQTSLVGLSDKASILAINIDAAKDLSKAVVYSTDVYSKFTKVLAGNSSNPSKDFSQANLELSDALVLIEKTKATKDVAAVIKEQINKNNDLLTFASSIQAVLPEIVGVDQKRKYLVLFQNNMELRSTGGFIGSYGLLSLNKGKASDFSISDVYDADGQLKGHVEPPFPIRRYLPSVHWYLRDSNFDFSFPKVASQAAFFLKVEKNEDVDGVVAINLSFVQKLLKVTGPVYVAEFSQSVTADNFFKLAIEHSEKNFFPGSTQKKDFLSAVFRAVKSKILDKKVSYVLLARTIGQALLEKNIIIASSNDSVQGLFLLNNWSSSLYDNREVKDGNINDFLEINESNFGVNKVNYFIERKVSKNTVIGEDGKISSELTIFYKNKSDGSWPGGGYKNYLRLALPLGTKISSIVIDGNSQQIVGAITDSKVYEDKKFTAPAGLEVENYQEDGKEIYGFLVNTPAKSSKTIVVDYVLSGQLAVSSLSSKYNLKIVKQPGINLLPIDVSISYPASLKLISSSNDISKQNGEVAFSKNITSDQELQLGFSSQ